MRGTIMRREQKIAMANARVSRRREQEALDSGDHEGARIQAEIASGYESDADFWAVVDGS
jgi:hypothetical protein